MVRTDAKDFECGIVSVSFREANDYEAHKVAELRIIQEMVMRFGDQIRQYRHMSMDSLIAIGIIKTQGSVGSWSCAVGIEILRQAETRRISCSPTLSIPG